MLEVSNLSTYYSNIKILKDISFNVEKGEVLCLLGRNGAGKTTTLKSIMGLINKVEGKVLSKTGIKLELELEIIGEKS